MSASPLYPPHTPTDEIANEPSVVEGSGVPADDVEPDASSVERMTALRRLVRREGLTIDEAARRTGVDPIIAQLWLRLPDDLWPGTRPAGQIASVGDSPQANRAPEAPAAGLRRVLTCRVPAPAYDRLRASEHPLLEAASAALLNGLASPRPAATDRLPRYHRRPLALPVNSETFGAIQDLAGSAFHGDLREAAGWLIARGVGMQLPLPSNESAPFAYERTTQVERERMLAPTPPARFVVPPRRRPETRAPLPPDDSAPDGEELRRRREAIGISQRDLAAASGLSRGLIAEVERGRRRHVLTRLRLAETLASLTRSS